MSLLRCQAEAGDDAARVGVDDEDGLVGRIEDDGVGGLLADAVDGQQFLPQFGSVQREQPVQITAVFLGQPIDKGL